ncbi:hypothetical protein [Hyphococcus sp.]|uniref:hypothetical protein n=1 Tax=Hyphococcus sp. TaxID=2038636 RepID=UPI003CCBADF4
MKKPVLPAMLKLFFGVFLVGSIMLFIAQFIGVDVKSEPDLPSKAALVVRQINWWVVFGMSAVAGLLVALFGALRNSPIAKSLDTRDDN